MRLLYGEGMASRRLGFFDIQIIMRILRRIVLEEIKMMPSISCDMGVLY